MRSLSLASYAKLNLYLEVLGRLPDRYHSIFTLFERVSLSDRISLKLLPHKGIRIILSNSNFRIPRGRNNLAYQAASLLKKEFHIRQGVEIRIRKYIPVAAGLGGGSSNAATVLQGLNYLWKLNLTAEHLISIARRIGSDTPFFLHNCSFACATSRGDEIKVLKLPVRLWHIIVVPRIKVLSPLIYKRGDAQFLTFRRRVPDGCCIRGRVLKKGVGLTQSFQQGSVGGEQERAGLTTHQSMVKIIKSALSKKDFIGLSNLLVNSLEPITAKMYPVIKKIKSTLSDLGVKTILMSGSGPAVFGLVSSRKEAYAIARQLSKSVTWGVFVAKTI